MKELVDRLKKLEERVSELREFLHLEKKGLELKLLEDKMSQADFWKDQETARKISQRASDLKKEKKEWEDAVREIRAALDTAVLDMEDQNLSMREELEKIFFELEARVKNLEFYAMFDGKYDESDAIVAFHAGAGGTEAQDWTEMLLRMITRYAERKGWSVAVVDEHRGQEAGIKSVTIRVEGRYAYGHLMSEHGVHRLVRISPFDAEKMRHTSFALIEVLPVLSDDVKIEIDPKDLRIDTFMSGGHGGQSVNTTYSAVRIVHIPTNITVTCQNERSQQQNKAVAMSILKSRLHQLEMEKMQKEKKELRGEYQSAEWGNQIRSYVLHPYKMVKDLRTRFETSDPDDVLNGNLDPFVEAYLRHKKLEIGN